MQRFAVWFGGSMLASTPEFGNVVHTRQQYEEYGPSVCRHNPRGLRRRAMPADLIVLGLWLVVLSAPRRIWAVRDVENRSEACGPLSCALVRSIRTAALVVLGIGVDGERLG
eukprot:scaffold66129_cov35-Tisochrysis_lutea.AAC.1